MRRTVLSEWTLTAILLLFGTTTLVQAFVIPSGSMEDTLLVGDHVLVDKLAYAPPGSLSSRLLPYQEVKRGDVIVFRYPLDLRDTYVKRCMGVPGDHVRIVDKQLYVNGRKMDEPYVIHKTGWVDRYRDYFPSRPVAGLPPAALDMLEHHVERGELVVPPGAYFALGDNRDESLDSRYWGFVPAENVMGKPLIIWWSYDAPREELSQPGIGARHAADVALHFFTKTRWNRTFRLIHGRPVEP